MTAHNIQALINRNHQQHPRTVQLVKTVDCSEINLTSGDTYTFLTIPAGFVLEQRDVFLLTAEGGAGTIDIGYSGGADYVLDGGNVNGTPDARIADGTNATNLAEGKLFAADTDLYITANAALDAAKFTVVFRGYLIDV